MGRLEAVVSGDVPFKLRLLVDLIALAGICWFAWYHAGFLVRDDLYLFGDHPGQFYRLWHLVQVWSEEGRFIGWSPYWFAGWPELQFYPPGFVLLGWLIWMGTFQQLSLVSVYQIVVFTSYLLPAVCFYLLLAWGLQNRLAGLAAAWLTLTTPVILGGVMGVIIGIIGERLAYGMIPLFILAGAWLSQAERKLAPWLVTGCILAGLLLLHPYQAMLPAVALGLYALFLGKGWTGRLAWLAAVILLSFGLTAFWWLPLGARSYLFVPVVEAPLVEIQSNLADLWLEGAGWLLAAAILGTLFHRGSRRWLPIAILLAGLATLGFVFFSHMVLAGRLNFYAFSSVRLITGITFVFFALVALGLSELAWLGPRLLHRRWRRGAWALPLVLIVPWLAYTTLSVDYDFSRWLAKWRPSPNRTPFFLKEAEARYDLRSAWEVMAATPGRVLYTSHYALLFDVPTSLKAVTPVLTGRELIGGVFTHRMPASTYLWAGTTDVPAMWGKVETTDDVSLAGIPWQDMTDEFFYDLARRFNVSLVAATATDVRARAFLDSAPHFEPAWSNGLFTFYTVAGYTPSYVEAQQAGAAVTRYTRREIDVRITEAAPGASLLVKVSYYPLWQAEAQGQPLPVSIDSAGLMQLSLPPGSYDLHLRYRLGWPELLGEWLSLISLLVVLAATALGIWRRVTLRPAVLLKTNGSIGGRGGDFGHIEEPVIGRRGP